MADARDDDKTIVTENVLDKHYAYVKDPSGYTVYKRRWFLLIVVMIVNFTNALIWIVFSPVTDLTSKYYKISFMQVNWLSLVFLVASIPSGFFASWVLDSIGLRASIIAAACLNFFGAGLRNLTIFSFIPNGTKFGLLMAGQTVAACGQTFIMFTPAKLAALWFPDSQRAIATTLATTANPLGILAANVLSPAVVKEKSDVPIVIWACSGCAIVGMLLSFCVSSSLPPSPPSPSAAAQSEPFFIGIKKLKNNKHFWYLTFSMGGGLALFTSMTTFMEQILCPRNYSNNFAGLCGALMIAFGTVGAIIAGIIVDKTRKFAEVAKFGFIISTLFSIAFVQVARMRDQEIAVAITIIMFGSFGFAIYPTCLEMAVEATYPVAEATSTGLIFLSGQIQGAILMLGSQYLAQPLSAYDSNLPKACPQDGEFDPQDWTIPNLLGNGLSVLYCFVLVLLFKPVYRRLNAEERTKVEASSVQSDAPADVVLAKMSHEKPSITTQSMALQKLPVPNLVENTQM